MTHNLNFPNVGDLQRQDRQEFYTRVNNVRSKSLTNQYSRSKTFGSNSPKKPFLVQELRPEPRRSFTEMDNNTPQAPKAKQIVHGSPQGGRLLKIQTGISEKSNDSNFSYGRGFTRKKPTYATSGIEHKMVYDSIGSSNMSPKLESPDVSRSRKIILKPVDDDTMKKLMSQLRQRDDDNKDETLEKIRTLKKELFGEYDRMHKGFMSSMKILNKYANEIDITHNHISSSISGKIYEDAVNRDGIDEPSLLKKVAKDNSGQDILNEYEDTEEFEETYKLNKVLNHEIENSLAERMKHRFLRKKLKKAYFEDFGTRISYYLRKITDRLIRKNNFEEVQMLSCVNKMIALELEDIWTNYQIQIDLVKKHPHEELLQEMSKDKSKIQSQKILLQTKDENYSMVLGLLQKQLERAHEDRRDLEKQLQELRAPEVIEKQTPIYQKQRDGTFKELTPFEALEDMRQKEIRKQKKKEEGWNSDDEEQQAFLDVPPPKSRDESNMNSADREGGGGGSGQEKEDKSQS